jgi:hypothetical protein
MTRFFIFRVRGEGSHSCCLKDALSHPLVRVCRNSKTLWQKMKNVQNNKRNACQKVSSLARQSKKIRPLTHFDL